MRLYVAPGSKATAQAQAWQKSDPRAAAVMRRLGEQPQAAWFSNQANDRIQAEVSAYVTAADAADGLPVLVAYHIFGRDCGKYSAGGASSVADYRDWIQRFAAGIGTRPAAVIVEPDALAELTLCLDAGQQQDRLGMIAAAVDVLSAGPRTRVYIDGGNAAAQPVATMAERLRAAGLDRADGFSLNVSGFLTTDSTVAYGDQLSARTGGAHYVIDTSRNGNGPTADYQWCNPPGRALGRTPSLQPGLGPAVDATLWVKVPGESDGSCNGGPPSGYWWPEYARDLGYAAGW
jgi:endoglucanase